MVSFDIFDTLITRATYSPAGVFACAAERVFFANKSEDFYYDGIIRDFVDLRISAEKNARRRAQVLCKKEVTLDDIYDVIRESNFVPDRIIASLEKEEIASEIDCAVLIRDNVKIIEEYIALGDTVVLISDMYLPKRVIMTILKKTIPQISELPLYVSGDIGRIKSDGSMFAYVREHEEVDYESWIHFGDDHKSDYIIPLMLGMRVGEISSPDIPKSLHYYSKHLKPSSLGEQIEMGCIKNTIWNNGIRLSSMKSVDKNGFVTGVSVGGPLIYIFVKWIVSDCKMKGTRDIYFLSRDGYALKKAADIIIKDEKLNISAHYLYSSRSAWKTRDTDILLKYAEQEIFLHRKVALVDVQGTGRTINRLVKSVRKKYEFNPIVYYYSYDFSDINIEYEIKSFSADKEDYYLEILCRAPENQLIELYEEDGIIKKRFEDSGVDWNDTGLLSYTEGVCEYIKSLLVIARLLDVDIRGRRIEKIVKEYVVNIGDNVIDEYLGDLPFEYSKSGGVVAYAKPLSKRQVREIYLLGNQDLIGGIERKIALRRSDKAVKEKVSDLNNVSCSMSKNDENALNTFLDLHINDKDCDSLRCVIYGAGEYGKTVFRMFNTSKKYDVIAWTDMNYERLNCSGMSIMPPFEIRKMSFDLIIVAIKDKRTAEDVSNMLKLIFGDSIRIKTAENIIS